MSEQKAKQGVELRRALDKANQSGEVIQNILDSNDTIVSNMKDVLVKTQAQQLCALSHDRGIVVLSLCCGILTLEVALTNLGVKIDKLYIVENDPHALMVVCARISSAGCPSFTRFPHTADHPQVLPGEEHRLHNHR